MIMIYEIIIQNLARDTQRTLVLPPVLPHVGDVTKKYDWGPRVNKVIEETSYIQMVKQDALQVAMGDPEQFPSFQALVDFNFLQQRYGTHLGLGSYSEVQYLVADIVRKC